MVDFLQPISAPGLVRTDLARDAQVGRAATVDGSSFGDVMREQINATISSVRVAEATSFAAIQGEASVREVTDAVMSAERNLQAASAIRDKIVTAYLDMTRMAI